MIVEKLRNKFGHKAGNFYYYSSIIIGCAIIYRIIYYISKSTYMAFIIGSIIIGIILFLSRNGERAFYFKNSLYYKVYKIKLLLFIPYYHRKIIDDYRGKI